MLDYYIDVPKNMDLRGLTIYFMKNASIEHNLRNDQMMEEINFLDEQYVMVKSQIVAESKDKDKNRKTDLLIYKL